MCQYLDVVPPGRDENRRHTRGSVEGFRKPLMRKRLVQIESKIAQFRLNVDELCKDIQKGKLDC
jgi:hypothetical protein